MYLSGFGNYHQSEAVEGALPKEQNSPQRSCLGLYPEQLSGTAFTRPRHNNLHSWLYRQLPSVAQGAYQLHNQQIINNYATEQSPNPLRWSPLYNELPGQVDFIDSLFHLAGSLRLNAYLYGFNHSMVNKYFANNDGEMLFVPFAGDIDIHTEFGLLSVTTGMIAVIPRGVKFKVVLRSNEAKGYLCENGGTPLTLPHLGTIGANGLANPRHFNYPMAQYEESNQECTIICKHQQQLWRCTADHSPLNVVAWHGNYAPYCYDLSLFNTINTVSFDHPDPSIFTVLTSESDTQGVAHLDFVIFPPRWLVAEHSFRPPYFHRNYMNELMGLIHGEYDAKKEGFSPGGISIHNSMVPHGPDYATFTQATKQELKPEYYKALAFMFESNEIWYVTDKAMTHSKRQKEYSNCWKGFPNNYKTAKNGQI